MFSPFHTVQIPIAFTSLSPALSLKYRINWVFSPATKYLEIRVFFVVCLKFAIKRLHLTLYGQN